MNLFKNFINKCTQNKRLKKVAFLAFLGANYGTILQSFALFKTIARLGYACEIIGAYNFINKPVPDKNNLDPNSKLYDTQLAQYNCAAFLRKTFPFSDILASIPGNCRLKPRQHLEINRYDAFVCGSDQIWLPGLHWFCPKLYLQFASPEKRVAYAPSLGRKKVDFYYVRNIPQWREWLKSVKYLSARESSGAATVAKLTGRPVATVLDPTFLLTAEEWSSAFPEAVIAEEPLKILKSGKKYVLAYLLDLYEEKKEFIKAFAKKHDLEIVWLAGRDDKGHIQINTTNTDPAGFVELMKNASFVFNDGFHGCCFSLIFSKPFAFFADPLTWDNEARIGDLFDKLDVGNRILMPDAAVDDVNFEMDYENIAKNIAHYRSESIAYLASALEGASADKKRAWLIFNEDQKKKIVNKLSRYIKRKLKKKKIEEEKIRIPLEDSRLCTGCGACENICPAKAIYMKADEYGFLYPQVVETKCINCGKCYNLCPLRKKPELYPRERPKHALAAWSKNPQIIQRSASGGIFPVLAEWVFAQGGTVYGTVYNADLNAHTIRAANMRGIYPMMGAKYVQGETDNSFAQVKKDLNAERPVLFSGTSCQIGGLYAYLGSDHPNLLTVDFVCNGVPSPAIFHKYLQWREKQFGKKIVNVEGGSKSENGWWPWLRFDFADGTKSGYPLFDDEYGILYGFHFIQRPSCFRCHYRGIDHRWADVTLGDFWRIGKLGIPFNGPTDQGISLVLANSEKARKIFASLQEKPNGIHIEQRPLEECFPANPWLLRNFGGSKWYGQVMPAICETDFETAFEKYFGDGSIRLKREI